MTHIVPILCLIFFCFFIEYRMKRDLGILRKKINILNMRIRSLEEQLKNKVNG